MSDNEIKPVARVEPGNTYPPSVEWLGGPTSIYDFEGESLYDQATIDRLTAELSLATGERNRLKLKWDEFRQTKNTEAQRLTAERDAYRLQATHETDVAEVASQEIESLRAERDAAVADAGRWNELCRQIDSGTFPKPIIDDAMGMGAGALELHIDAARAQEPQA